MCVFVFEYAKCLFSDAAANFMILTLANGSKRNKVFFRGLGTIPILAHDNDQIIILIENN